MSSDPESILADPLKIFTEAVENCKPVVGVIAMRRGGRVFQVCSLAIIHLFYEYFIDLNVHPKMVTTKESWRTTATCSQLQWSPYISTHKKKLMRIPKPGIKQLN